MKKFFKSILENKCFKTIGKVHEKHLLRSLIQHAHLQVFLWILPILEEKIYIKLKYSVPASKGSYGTRSNTN